jgi:hypothetical protein
MSGQTLLLLVMAFCLVLGFCFGQWAAMGPQ